MKRSKRAKRSRKVEKRKSIKPDDKEAATTFAPVATPRTVESLAPIENVNKSGGAAIEEVIDKTAPTTSIPASESEDATQAKPATATATGARYAVLAGRPSKHSVVAVFGKSGYALSWVARAERLGIAPEELCERFKTDPEGVKSQWESFAAKKA